MSTKFSRKPPLSKSLATSPRRAIQSPTSISSQTAPGSTRKPAMVLSCQDAKKMGTRVDFVTMACDMQALALMVKGKNWTEDENCKLKLSSPIGANSNNCHLFERGRFYDLYSAKRNERLKRKPEIEMEDDHLKKCCGKYDLGVTSGTMKRQESKRMESGRRKSLSVDLRTQPSRYSLRSSKDNTKPLMRMSLDTSCGVDASLKTKKTGSAKRVVRKA